MQLPNTSRAGQLFNHLNEGDIISVEQLATQFARANVAAGYELDEASDEHLKFSLYVRLDSKNTGCVQLLKNLETGKTKVHKKLLKTWAVNWSKLTKVRI